MANCNAILMAGYHSRTSKHLKTNIDFLPSKNTKGFICKYWKYMQLHKVTGLVTKEHIITHIYAFKFLFFRPVLLSQHDEPGYF